MKNFSLICFIDTPALNLCGSEDTRESLIDEKELAPFNFIGDSCFMGFRANRPKDLSPACPTQGFKSRPFELKAWQSKTVKSSEGLVSFFPDEPKLKHTDTSTNAKWSDKILNSLSGGRGLSFLSGLLTSRFLSLQTIITYV